MSTRKTYADRVRELAGEDFRREVERFGHRTLDSQRVQPGWLDRGGEDAPTPRQIASVIRALADHELGMWLASDSIETYGSDSYLAGGPKWARSAGIGRFFHALADNIIDRSRT